MQVTVATPADHPEIAALNVAAYEEFRAHTGEEVWARMRANLEAVDGFAAGGEILVAREDGRLLGAVAYYPPGSTAPPLPAEWASVRVLAVDPSARGRGVAAALMEACIARARAQGAAVLGLYTTEMMAAARALYARLGFVQDAELPPRHGQPCRRYRLDLAPDAAATASSVAAPDAASRLAALAAEGRARQAAALAAEADEARRSEMRERREVERLGRGYVRAALLESPRGAAPPLLPVAMAMVVAGTVLLVFGDLVGLRQPFWPKVGMGLVLLAIVGFFGGRWVMAPWLVRRERAWLQALPFPVRGWFRTLGQAPEEERRVRVRIEFRGEPPEREVLEGLFGRVAIPATARLAAGQGASWRAESGPIRSPAFEDVDPTNGAVLRWMRGVVEEVLLPLHAVHPLQSVEFRG
ncbi:MAG: GNAT family N-acetyltransferase [Longimicrobiaceae bacterium]